MDLSSPPFCNALRLFPRVSDCDLYNDQELHKLTSATAQLFETSHVILESRRCTHGALSYEHIREELIPKDDKECGGLPRRLKLAVGAELMLRRNIKCGDGLVNGARGIMVGFKWPGNVKNPPSPGALPEYVHIKFHDPRVGKLNKVPIENGHQEVVPIEPMSVRFYGRQGTVLQRTLLPLILWWAATLHKVQGLSFDAAVLDLGEKVFEPGMAYVALSCVRTLDGVALSSFEPQKVKANKRVHAEMARLRKRSGSHDTSDNESQTSHLLVHSSSSLSNKPNQPMTSSVSVVATPVPSVQRNSSPPIQTNSPTKSAPGTDMPSVQNNSFLIIQPQPPIISVPHVVSPVLSLQEELETMVNCENPATDLISNWAKCHEGDIKATLMEVNQPSRVILSSFHSTDVGVREKLLPAFTLFYVPVYTTGSGNCMYNIILLTLTGTVQYMSHLRLLTAYSLITHREHMFEVIQPTAKILLPLNERSAASVFKEAEIQWLDLVRSSLQDGSWRNQFHLHALSIALERSICLYGVMRNRTVQHQGRQLQRIDLTPSAAELQNLFDAKDKRLNNSIIYHPNVEKYSPLLGFFDASHFTAILPANASRNSTEFSPFTTFASLWTPEE